ncbi:retinol dehydrogenase [Rhypophila decipiens]
MASLIWHPIRRLLFGPPSAPSISFDPARDIPSLAGKVILITGGAGDLGKALAIEYARHGPAQIYIADLAQEDNGEAVIRSIRESASLPSEGGGGVLIKFIDIDLASFESVRKAASRLKAEIGRLDILVNNAGVVLMRNEVSVDGYELTWAINFMGHALLTKLLLPTLLSTASQPESSDVRIIVVSSEGHAMVPPGGIVFDQLKTPCKDISYVHRYGQTKLALIHYAKSLSLLHPGITTVSVHPGRILTGLFRRLQKDSKLFKYTALITPLFTTSVENGVRNHLWASTAPIHQAKTVEAQAGEAATGNSDNKSPNLGAVVSGTYYEPVGVTGKESALARDEALRVRLWEWVEGELDGQVTGTAA